ncbi:MAG: glycine oxidase ThiO [Acidobacteria bacterium]|nr:glycine oxidase ThiO [Acidobacteriota bacterium]
MKVIVIGAGVIGVAVADALAGRGAAVSVLEMRAVGAGASQASAGMLAPFKEAHGDARVLELGTRSLALFDDWIASLRASTGLPIEYARTGTLEVALDEQEAGRLHADRAALQQAGCDADLLVGDEVRRCEPAVAGRAVAALLTRPHGFVGVQPLVRALAERARLAGAIFETPVEAASVECMRDGVEVKIEDRRLSADAVVLAAGCWSRRVRVQHLAALPVRPVRGQLLHLRWTGPQRPSRIVWGPRCYTVPWTDGSLLVGATAEDVGFDERATVAGVQALTSAVADLLPDSAGAALDEVRVGLRPASPDGLPLIGPVARAPRVVVAAGHFRNGILLAPLTAELVSGWLLDGTDDPAFALTSPNRFL